jgi:hypothetical protein
MKYAFELGSGAIYIYTTFRKDWFRRSKVNGVGYTDIQIA